MVTFPDLSNLSSNPNIGNLLALPSSSYPYFWAWILAGIGFIITLTLYFTEKAKSGKGKLLASLAVACFTIIVLATVGTIIGIIDLDIMIRFIVVCFLIIGVWFFTNS